MNLHYTFDGALDAFDSCTLTDPDRPTVWSVSGGSERTKHTAIVVVNHIRVTKEQVDDETPPVYHSAYFSSAFELR